MASRRSPSSTPMWATAQGRALLLAIGTCSILLATKFSSGCSAEKDLIPLGRTATGCSATCGDICPIPDSPFGGLSFLILIPAGPARASGLLCRAHLTENHTLPAPPLTLAGVRPP